MSSENNVQVKEGYYTKKKYNSLPRFISYFYQVDVISSLSEVKEVLEIGPGSKLVSRELEHIGYKVTTCDFDQSVNPDVVSDIRELPFEDNSFDCVMACQVLEHIPYEDFEKVLEELSKITRKYLIISLPSRLTIFKFIFKFPFIQTFFKKSFLDLSFQFPVKFPGFEVSSQHYWEIDFWTTSRRKVENSIRRNFKILNKFKPPLNKYHQFYVLEEK